MRLDVLALLLLVNVVLAAVCPSDVGELSAIYDVARHSPSQEWTIANLGGRLWSFTRQGVTSTPSIISVWDGGELVGSFPDESSSFVCTTESSIALAFSARSSKEDTLVLRTATMGEDGIWRKTEVRLSHNDANSAAQPMDGTSESVYVASVSETSVGVNGSTVTTAGSTTALPGFDTALLLKACGAGTGGLILGSGLGFTLVRTLVNPRKIRLAPS